MSAEPTSGELKNMRTIGQVLDWVPINDPALREAWLKDLGLAEGDPVRSLADIEKEDIEKVRDSLRIAGTGLNPAARGRVVKSWRVARLAAGTEKTKEEVERVDQEKRSIVKLQAEANLKQAQSSNVTALAVPESSPNLVGSTK